MARAAVFGCLGTRLSAEEAAFFKDVDPWGFILFARNIETPDQVRRLCAELRSALGRERAPIFIDQEGGRVQRMRAPHWCEWPPALDEDPMALNLRYRLIGAELRAVGITGNCAPVLDIAQHDSHPILRNRCLGEDTATVAERGHVVADALLSVGVMPVMKHIPGQGRSKLDSHVDLPVVTTSYEDLLSWEFKPFQSLNQLPLAMTSHIVFEAIDDNPATFSQPVVDAIRREIGFDGLLLTDDLSMGALGGPYKDRAERALAAGCDVILHCNGEMEQMRAVAEELPVLSGPRLDRAEASLSCGKPQDVVDFDEELAQYSAIKRG